MSSFGWLLICTMATAFLPWSFLFDALGRGDYRKPLCWAMSGLGLAATTVALALLLFAYPSDYKSVAMNIFLLLSIHILSIAFGAIVWAIVGQQALRGFLIRPQWFLLFALVVSLCAVALGLTFSPSDI